MRRASQPLSPPAGRTKNANRSCIIPVRGSLGSKHVARDRALRAQRGTQGIRCRLVSASIYWPWIPGHSNSGGHGWGMDDVLVRFSRTRPAWASGRSKAWDLSQYSQVMDTPGMAVETRRLTYGVEVRTTLSTSAQPRIVRNCRVPCSSVAGTEEYSQAGQPSSSTRSRWL